MNLWPDNGHTVEEQPRNFFRLSPGVTTVGFSLARCVEGLKQKVRAFSAEEWGLFRN